MRGIPCETEAQQSLVEPLSKVDPIHPDGNL
jgi:hypothetical protein